MNDDACPTSSDVVLDHVANLTSDLDYSHSAKIIPGKSMKHKVWSWVA